MGCDVYVFRKNSESKTPHGDIFWDVKSWDLGYELALVAGIGSHYQEVSADALTELARDLIKQGKDDHCEYPDGALRALLEDMKELDDVERTNSKWYLILDY